MPSIIFSIGVASNGCSAAGSAASSALRPGSARTAPRSKSRLWTIVRSPASPAGAAAALPEGAIQWGFLAAALATGLSSLGAGIAVASVGSAAIGAIAEKPELMGRVLQHEIDHLNGILLLERLPKRTRKAALRDLRREALGMADELR